MSQGFELAFLIQPLGTKGSMTSSLEAWRRQSPKLQVSMAVTRQAVVAWSHDSKDYPDATDREICNWLVVEMSPGTILHLHDARFGRPASDRSKALRSVDAILQKIGDELDFGTVPKLLMWESP